MRYRLKEKVKFEVQCAAKMMTFGQWTKTKYGHNDANSFMYKRDTPGYQVFFGTHVQWMPAAVFEELYEKVQ